MTTRDELADAFPGATEQAWRDAVDRVLKGRSFDQVLVGATRGGLVIDPLYRDGSGHVVAPVSAERVAHGWDVRQQHRGGDPAECRANVLQDLQHGVTSVELMEPAEGWSLESLRSATEGVLLEAAPVALAPHHRLESAAALIALLDEQRAGASRCWLGLDPIGAIARSGSPADLGTLARFGADARRAHSGLLSFTVDTTVYVDAGAHEVHELGWMLASGVALLRALEEVGVAPGGAAASIGFRVSVDADQFLSIARLRAARIGWMRVLEASGVDTAARTMTIQAVTTRSMFSRRDPWVNMLRSTTATFGAAVGGADAITVLTHDGSESPLARRNARNVQVLLMEESGVHRLADPATGSFAVESLTARLAEAAWAEFQRIEAAGGMVAALTDATIRAAVDDDWAARLGRIATRGEPITGVSEYPDQEPGAGPAADAGDDDGGFPLRRPAAPFEQLRDAADHAAADGRSVSVHLATLGPLATHTARSTWVTNLLAAGGLRAAGDEAGAASPAEAAARFAVSGDAVAVLCSSDDIYAEQAAATATALVEAGAGAVLLAGNPGDHRSDWEAAGVDAFLHVGIDVLEALHRIHAWLGIDSADGIGTGGPR